MKKNAFSYVLISVLLVTQFLSCSKNPKCSGSDEQHGIIADAITITCVPVGQQEKFTIDDYAAYTLLFPGCDVPSIDFRNYTLLGLSASGGCEVKFIREVKRLDDEHRYHYKVTVKECGRCKKLGTSYNWVIVPKLPNNWTVSFEIEK
jgi:hypothetical protein